MTWVDQAAALFGVALSEAQQAHFAQYMALLTEWNAHTNLTGITDPVEIEVRHFLDSLSVVKACPMRPGLRVIDVGSGAGFPGLPLALVYPEIHVTLLESTGKKIAFLDHVIQALSLQNCVTLNARAEDAGHLRDQRAAYDLVVARAVARLPALLEYLLPLAKVGGRCVAMKGAATAQSEVDDARNALRTLGGKLLSIQSVALPNVAEAHALVVIEKTAHTPTAYPRKPGIPTKKPL